MKTIYQVLSKDEKKQVKAIFRDKKRGQSIRLNRLFILGLIILIYCLFSLILTFLSDNPNIYLIGVYILFIGGALFFIFESFVIRLKEYNKITKETKK